MHLKTGYEKRRARIEMVPLMDVVFLLLVFFIYAMLSMTVNRGIQVRLPSASGSPESIHSMVITVDSENLISIEGSEVTMAEAVESAIAHSSGSDTQVLINGDRASDLGIAVELLSLLRKSGVESVSFLVQDKGAGRQ